MQSPVFGAGSVTIAALLLSGCVAADAVPEPTASASAPSVVPSPEVVTPNPIEADTMLILRATATAANGAQISLEYQVHQSVAWDDVAGAAMPEVTVELCGDTLSLAQFKNERWSFTRSNVTAIPLGDSPDWPTDATIEVRPSPDPGSVVARGLLVDAGGASSPCLQAKEFSTIGRGGMALGLPGDAAESNGFTGWARQSYGFRATASGVTLSDCSVEVSQLGREFGGGSGSWTTAINDTTCLAGAADRVD